MKTRTALLFSSVLCVLCATLVLAQTAVNAPRLTDLFSADEAKRAGLSKLNADEISALNAAIFRVVVSMNDEPETKVPARKSSEGERKDLDFYDSHGRAAAYVDDNDGSTIYLWDGKPVAYLDEDSIFGFNGKHLGWLSGGAIYDHDGKMVAALPDVFRSAVSVAPVKSFKQFVPFKAFEEFKPFKPFFTLSWSETPARLFFLRGAN